MVDSVLGCDLFKGKSLEAVRFLWYTSWVLPSMYMSFATSSLISWYAFFFILKRKRNGLLFCCICDKFAEIFVFNAGKQAI